MNKTLRMTAVAAAAAALAMTSATANAATPNQNATASARILRSLPDQDDGDNQRGALTGRPDETSVLNGVEASNGRGNSRHGGQ